MSGDVRIIVYGANERCASCVNAPGSKETYEWLQAAIGRKYHTDHLFYRYVDLYEDEHTADDQKYIEKIKDDELFYPLVVINDEVAGEGNPKLKEVYAVLEKNGVEPL
ncbi:putative disulfide oxidoreductase YuzD [Halobacillus andaensis]|uniref:Disulfide oxidoreductase YuzD n=1 Tax=Halobacillus andaensis TaxID=1176239 RepID=A0A917BBI8_HALAA|nr:YuzD family protein [Halobacillus andaensis]MBP2005587.1 disulfide oxidoreductase YuzD [Halobacillus andaensis]GGF32642.1 putative disulfide oxidoreductase YuzD [Halobacillus andaensis]